MRADHFVTSLLAAPSRRVFPDVPRGWAKRHLPIGRWRRSVRADARQQPYSYGTPASRIKAAWNRCRLVVRLTGKDERAEFEMTYGAV